MKPINIGGHSAHQKLVLTQLRKYYPDAAVSLPESTWQILEKFWSLDLSAVDTLMQDRYSVFGPEPRLPSDMLRALLVSVAFKITSYTRFAADLKENHPPKQKPQKPKGKEEKAAPVEKVTVDDLFRQFEENPPSSFWQTIQGSLMILPVAVKNGSRNLMQELLRNAVTNVRK